MSGRLQAAEQAAAEANTRVQQAEQAASAAAHQAAAAQRQQVAQGGHSTRLADTRSLGRLCEFKSVREDWKDWSFQFRARRSTAYVELGGPCHVSSFKCLGAERLDDRALRQRGELGIIRTFSTAVCGYKRLRPELKLGVMVRDETLPSANVCVRVMQKRVRDQLHDELKWDHSRCRRFASSGQVKAAYIFSVLGQAIDEWSVCFKGAQHVSGMSSLALQEERSCYFCPRVWHVFAGTAGRVFLLLLSWHVGAMTFNIVASQTTIPGIGIWALTVACLSNA
eukprot:4086372-Amphidinium_carterae.1